MLWLSCEGQIHVGELFSDKAFLSAVLDRKGLLVAAPVDLRTKRTESFSPQLLKGFWSKLKKLSPKIVVMSPTVTTETPSKKKSYGNSTVCAWPWHSIKYLVKNASFFFFWTRIRTDLSV